MDWTWSNSNLIWSKLKDQYHRIVLKVLKEIWQNVKLWNAVRKTGIASLAFEIATVLSLIPSFRIVVTLYRTVSTFVDTIFLSLTNCPWQPIYKSQYSAQCTPFLACANLDGKWCLIAWKLIKKSKKRDFNLLFILCCPAARPLPASVSWQKK